STNIRNCLETSVDEGSKHIKRLDFRIVFSSLHISYVFLKKLYALCAYTPPSGSPKKFLKFEKDDEFILEDGRNEWWLVRQVIKKDNNIIHGKKGYIPSNFVERKSEKEVLEWCNHDYKREDAENELRIVEKEKEKYEPGSFIVRPTSGRTTLEGLALSVKFDQMKIVHFEIIRKDGTFHVRNNSEDHSPMEKLTFPTLTKLIHHYARSEGLKSVNDPQMQRLAHSIKKKIDAWAIDHSEIKFSAIKKIYVSEIDQSKTKIGDLIGKGAFGEVRNIS
ncbi:hypothetical protein PENTCL1PPCAC_21329, partial [Pristionchus entomophagus]